MYKERTYPSAISLNGQWEYLELDTEMPDTDDWKRAFWGDVPGTVHKALWNAGMIPDPMIGCNQEIAREHSFHTWWLRKRFTMDPKSNVRYRLSFEGVADRCTVWLNKKEIVSHQGMFGGPEVDLTGLLEGENELLVKLEPIPFRPEDSPNPDSNDSWKDTVVINNVYGWHYFNMPSLGIWRPVILTEIPKAELKNFFVFTRDPYLGSVGLTCEVEVLCPGDITMEIQVIPHNFEGEKLSYQHSLDLTIGTHKLAYEFNIPEPKLWWPNGMGESNLYEVLVFCQHGDSISAKRSLFGLRNITMAPLPEGPEEHTYNWWFEINGKKVFIKGTNWCTMDALLDISRERYNRFLSLARDQHLQLLRAWGGGMPETNDFYDLCSEYGIMVMQEWPTAWDSHETQPMAVMEETIRRNTIRIRNYPALVMYAGGNESPNPFGEMIDLMGRLAIELDGTRPFHRGEPYGGSVHDYGSWWENQHIDHHLTAEAPFWGEFGFASVPCMETFSRYMPKGSKYISELGKNRDFLMHTPTFGFKDDVRRLLQSAHYFMPAKFTWRELIISTQLTQALGVRRVIDRSRARSPECAGVVYYKMNDNGPAASWSCVDYFGVPKIAYYVVQDSYESARACILLDRLNFENVFVSLPVYLLDDFGLLQKKPYKVTVRAYNNQLRCIKEESFSTNEKWSPSRLLGRFELLPEQTDTTPISLVCDLTVEGVLQSRSFYFSNVEKDRGCVFRLPRASVRLETVNKDSVIVYNEGEIPSVGLWLTVPGKNHQAVFSDNFLWLDSGERKQIKVGGVCGEEVELEGLNLR